MRLVTYLPDMRPELRSALSGAPEIESVLTDSEDAFIRELSKAEGAALYSGSYNERLAAAVAAAPSLRWIQAGSTGYDRLLRFGVPDHVRISTAGDLWAGTVAEHALALLLGLLRRMPMIEAQKVHRDWNRQAIRESVGVLEGKRVAVIGMGAIGRGIAKRLNAFDTRVVAVVRHPERASADICDLAGCVTDMDGLRRHLDEIDVVMPAVPLSADTEGMIDADFLGRMKSDALLVNIARGEVVEEGALTAVLAAGRLGGAGLDVYEREPLPADSPLWNFENVILSPHVGGFGDPRRLNVLASLLVENAERYLGGLMLRNELGRRQREATRSPETQTMERCA